MNPLQIIRNRTLYFDGGTGSVLQARGLQPGEMPELWNLTHPEQIQHLHSEYLDAGCDIIKTNTFGANNLKYENVNGKFCLENIISTGIENARKAIDLYCEKSGEKAEKKYVALDIGPSGKLLKPLGDLDFEDAVRLFAETVRLGVKYGADLVLIETMNDAYETKAAIVAAKENSTLPIFVTNAYDESGKLMTGATPSAMVALLEGLGVSALGVNCSLGAKQLKKFIPEILASASIPVIVSPNAGMPCVHEGKTCYDSTPEDFTEEMIEIADMGVSILGGCCGTTPKHIELLTSALKNKTPKKIVKKNITVVSSYAKA